MRLHTSVIKEMIRIFETHGGFLGEKRIREALAQMDLSTYLQNSTGREVLVLTKELDEKSRE